MCSLERESVPSIPLENRYAGIPCIEGSNPSLSATRRTNAAPVTVKVAGAARHVSSVALLASEGLDRILA